MARVALITGGSSGIGLAIAKRLADDHVIVLASSNIDRLQLAQSALLKEREGCAVATVAMDVTDPARVDAGIEEVVCRHGRIDILINSAGIGGGGRTIELPESHWSRIVETNLNGAYRVTLSVLRQSGMTERGWGRIINIASTGGKQGVVFATAYSASKHGLVGLSKSLGIELAKTGVTVNAVCPGFVETPMAERARQGYAAVWGCSIEEAKRRIEERVPLGRYVTPDEVAEMVRYLVSDAAGPIVGQAINVCGGLGVY